MAQMIDTVTVGSREIFDNMTIRLRLSRAVYVRLWIAKLLIRFASFVSGVRFEALTDD